MHHAQQHRTALHNSTAQHSTAQSIQATGALPKESHSARASETPGLTDVQYVDVTEACLWSLRSLARQRQRANANQGSACREPQMHAAVGTGKLRE